MPTSEHALKISEHWTKLATVDCSKKSHCAIPPCISLQSFYIWAAVKINCLRLVQKYMLSLFGGGPIAFQCFVQTNTKYCKNAREWASRIQISTAGGGLRAFCCLCVCNHVGELSKHIPRLFPKQGNLLRSHLRTRTTVFDIDQWFQQRRVCSYEEVH